MRHLVFDSRIGGPMSICLCNLSADTILELVAQKRFEVTPASPDPSSFCADSQVAHEALGALVELLPNPIELLVENQLRRRHVASIIGHVWRGPWPRHSILALDEGVYVTSPELTLLQQASQLHQVNLCQMLGRYLGTWTPKLAGLSGQDNRAPLTNLEQLNNFLAEAKHARGTGNLRLAMEHTCDGAASAPETSLQLALCLPPELHGLNITRPLMNYQVNFSPQAQRLYPHESIRIDLCWPHKNFGLEYQGDEHGTQLGEDYARWFAAREEGYELWFVAKEQLESASQMMCIGREVAKRIDLDPNGWPWPTEHELQDLLNVLANQSHPKPISYDELRERRAATRNWQR